jgi:hypothetical protein
VKKQRWNFLSPLPLNGRSFLSTNSRASTINKDNFSWTCYLRFTQLATPTTDISGCENQLVNSNGINSPVVFLDVISDILVSPKVDLWVLQDKILLQPPLTLSSKHVIIKTHCLWHECHLMGGDCKCCPGLQ